jgi:exopolysaccharide biosynthesis polyprenyl glycosylphosphotransferase
MSLLANKGPAARRRAAALRRAGDVRGTRGSVHVVPIQRRPEDHQPEESPAAGRDQRRTGRERLKGEERRYITQLYVIDGAAAALSGLVAYMLLYPAVTGPYVSSTMFLLISALFPAVWIGAVGFMRAYEPRFLYTGREEFRRVLHATIAVGVAGALISYALHLQLSRQYLLTLTAVVLVSTVSGRYGHRTLLRVQRGAGSGWMRKVVVAGHEDEVRAVVSDLRRSPEHGYEVVGVCLVEETEPASYDVPVTAGITRIADTARRLSADGVVVLPCHHLGPSGLRRLGWDLEHDHTQMFVAPGLLDVARQRATLAPVGHLALLHVDHPELSGSRRLIKEVFDRTTAALALLVLLPFLGVLMLAVRLDSPGPVIFRQERVGRGHENFTLWKFRTMVTDAEHLRESLMAHNDADGMLFKIRNDPRVTRVGRFLRKYSLDELPQLVNVLLGHMSLVGPRPPLPAEVLGYEDDVRRRMVVKPGITGLWQVSGRSDLPWDEAVRLDLRYVENWSLAMDLAILWRTWRAVVDHDGAY